MTKVATQPQSVDAIAEAHAKALSEYEQIMDDKIQQYEAVVAKAQADLTALVQAATASQPKPVQKPEASWSDVNGEQYLVLNKAAAEFFSDLFEQVGVLATELGKAYNK